MTNLIHLIPYFIASILLVTLADTLGAIVSRKFNINYGYLSLFSFAIYLSIGYFVSKESGLYAALLVGIIVGFYDATAGWKISRVLQAHTGLTEEEAGRITYSTNLKIMLVVAPLFIFIGYLIA